MSVPLVPHIFGSLGHGRQSTELFANQTMRKLGRVYITLYFIFLIHLQKYSEKVFPCYVGLHQPVEM